MSRSNRTETLLLALFLIGLTGPGADVRADDAPPRPRTSLERLERKHLAATHADVAALAQRRQAIPPLPGRHDFRAILHAHAEDSAHTGGTRPEMLADAKRAGVHAILLSDHYRPPRDFITQSWRGLHEGVLFLPGSEDRGFLVYPTRSILDRMTAPEPEFITAVRADDGLIFLSHLEERLDHPPDDLDGYEIYNRHHDAKKDTAGILGLILRLTDPTTLAELRECLELYPDAFFAAQASYPAEYLAKWDRDTAKKRLTGVAANDCHHNTVLIVKVVDANNVRVGTNVDADEDMRTVSAVLRPGVRALTKDRQPGDVVARLDVDPYHRSFRNASTHVLATELAEGPIRAALRDGHAYVSHDWMCDPTGFRFEAHTPKSGPDSPPAILGDELPLEPGTILSARFPVACKIRLLRAGKVVAETTGDHLDFTPSEPGVYRVEGWLTLDGEERPWIYSNPIYVR